MTADGVSATVEGERVVPGAARMWDLTVATVHTFAVGDAQAVVHNCDPLDGWGRSHSKHFRDDWEARGRPSPIDMEKVLTDENSVSLYDTKTGNYGLAGKIKGKWHTIWYDATDDNKLVSLTDESHGSFRPGAKNNGGRRWMPAGLMNPYWRNPFI